ncbi:MAG: copper transport protein [Thelocarpon superellum]|nr:MAG: copper transport protein [Thelocarpon superellum]
MGKYIMTRMSYAHVVQLKVILIMALSQFENPGLIDNVRMDRAMDGLKHCLACSQKSADVRLALGLCPDLWLRLTDVFTHAIPPIESQSYHGKEMVSPGHHGVLVSFVPLLRDLELLNDLSTLARNMLATKSEAQDLAADAHFEQLVLRLIHVCLRVTARGFDADKKLLITCLQFLHNFVMNNERRKLLLWMDLFGSSQCADPSFMGRVDPAAYFQAGDDSSQENSRGKGEPTGRTKDRLEDIIAMEARTMKGMGLEDIVQSQIQMMNTAMSRTGLADAKDGKRPEPPQLSPSLIRHQVQVGAGLGQNKAKQAAWSEGDESDANAGAKEAAGGPMDLDGRPIVSPLLMAANFTTLDRTVNSKSENDAIMYVGPAAAARALAVAKTQLLERVHNAVEPRLTEDDEANVRVYAGALEQGRDGILPEDSVEDDESGYQAPSEQERGLLTDIPLVLGPNEIEALPMIIQTGIVDAFATKNPVGITENMQAIRCNILVAQESGRNLLRELLIFVAAWDLADDELFFKMMMQIMESLLVNGLVPCTYGWFQEQKDIISPSQAVMIKLLTQIFRAKQTQPRPLSASRDGRITIRKMSRADILVVRYIFGQFRLTVIPETCALIYLQGQIRAGTVEPEDFPLNLWDMERVYEGVYQFLEFFAVLTEAEEWKRLLVDWQITHELIALLRELHASIPSGRLGAGRGVSPSAPTGTASRTAPAPAPAPAPVPAPAPAPVAVERPYDPSPHSPAPESGSAPSSPAGLAADNPEEFEWRNLKKLVVLVLSSLVWKAPAVQDQVREHGGVEIVLQCCAFDAHNPYIREHAIMCLRFLLEGNEANMQLVRELQPQDVVPSEVLDQGGYETFIDQAGRVGLRRKERGGGSTAQRGTDRGTDPGIGRQKTGEES